MSAETSVVRKITKEEERERLFTHGLHEENIFHNRLNIFLVCESLLFASVVSSLSGEHRPAPSILKLICGVGILVSLLWWVARTNKLALYKTLVTRAKAELDEFSDTLDMSKRERWRGVLQAWSGSTMLAHSFPALFTIVWGILLYITL
jgi:hypothetical protein